MKPYVVSYHTQNKIQTIHYIYISPFTPVPAHLVLLYYPLPLLLMVFTHSACLPWTASVPAVQLFLLLEMFPEPHKGTILVTFKGCLFRVVLPDYSN